MYTFILNAFGERLEKKGTFMICSWCPVCVKRDCFSLRL